MSDKKMSQADRALDEAMDMMDQAGFEMPVFMLDALMLAQELIEDHSDETDVSRDTLAALACFMGIPVLPINPPESYAGLYSPDFARLLDDYINDVNDDNITFVQIILNIAFAETSILEPLEKGKKIPIEVGHKEVLADLRDEYVQTMRVLENLYPPQPDIMDYAENVYDNAIALLTKQIRAAEKLDKDLSRVRQSRPAAKPRFN